MPKFDLVSKYKPAGDQPGAIETLTNGVLLGIKDQTLLGVTGSGKTFTMANIIKNTGKSALILAHNKTLAAQLFTEFKEFFPNNAVEYFVSYYDYYQPEAYVARRDLYIEKESNINETIESYRSAATQSLLSRNDVIIIASVSCIYGLGNPADYMALSRVLKVGESYEREKLLIHLNNMQYERSEFDFKHGDYRVRGDTVEINVVQEGHSVRVSYFGDEIDSIAMVDTLTGEIKEKVESVKIFPAKQFVTPFEKLKSVLGTIRSDMEKEVAVFRKLGKDLEATRLLQRTTYDLELLQEIGYCGGIENYSRYIDKRKPGEPPSTLLDYFPDDWLLFVDESHMTIPQVRGMYNGDQARKQSLVDYGFRLKAAKDNRPLKFKEFKKKVKQTVYVSATPADYELEQSFLATKNVRGSNPNVFIE